MPEQSVTASHPDFLTGRARVRTHGSNFTDWMPAADAVAMADRFAGSRNRGPGTITDGLAIECRVTGLVKPVDLKALGPVARDCPQLPDWRSGWGHAMADGVQDLLRGYDLTAPANAEMLFRAVCNDLGICKPHRLPVPARVALLRWCQGAMDAAQSGS